MANTKVDGKTDVVLVMVPLPAQGHLNQLLHLAHHVSSSHNIPVHFVGIPTHNRQARVRVHGWDPSATSRIHFHDFPVSPFPAQPADPNTANKLPVHLVPAFNAAMKLREPVFALLQDLAATSRKVVVIHDWLMNYVIQDVQSVPNAESYCYHGAAAFTMYSYYWEMAGKPVMADGVPVNELLRGGPGTVFPKELADFIRLQQVSLRPNWGNVYNTSRLIDGEYLDLLAQEQPHAGEKHWGIGPFHPLETKMEKSCEKTNKCLEWLDKQADKSVIFVSFGSTTSLSDEQFEEMAIALEKSGQKFIWVVRDADRGDIFEGKNREARLPEGFEERMTDQEKGIVVRDWAPQLEILGHSSTGGFMSHCGWNSCIESISLGVPMAAWPMHSDQPRNAILVTKVLKIGIMVGDWGHEGELVKAEVVENVVRRLMDSDEGHEMRKKAAELSNAINKSVTKNGGVDNASTTEMDAFIAHITR